MLGVLPTQLALLRNSSNGHLLVLFALVYLFVHVAQNSRRSRLIIRVLLFFYRHHEETRLSFYRHPEERVARREDLRTSVRQTNLLIFFVVFSLNSCAKKDKDF